MNLLRESVVLLVLKLLLVQVVSSKVISLKDGEITYEYDNESNPLGDGYTGTVYKGIRKYGNRVEAVAIKMKHRVLVSDPLKRELDGYERVGAHESIPILYGYYPETIRTSSFMVIQLLGRNLYDLLEEYHYFSTATAMRVGLQVLDVLEHIHKHGVVHNDAHIANLAVGYQDDSKIFLFDFGDSDVITEVEKEDQRKADLTRLVDSLKYMTIGLKKHGAINNNNVDCNETLEEFEQKVQNLKSDQIDYEELRRILRTELEKHKNEPNYEKFDWQN